MALFVVFIVGIANFAMHRAVLESGHPMLVELQWTVRSVTGRMGFAFEFILLVAGMLLASMGAWGWLMVYFFYSCFNATVCWMFLTRRI